MSGIGFSELAEAVSDKGDTRWEANEERRQQ
jgi:hypothetical protein